MSVKDIVARNVLAARRSRGEVARKAGGDEIDAGVIRRMEKRATTNIQLHTLYEVCRYYGVSLPAFVSRPLAGRPLPPWPADYPGLEDLQIQVRLRLRQWRHKRGVGTPTVAIQARLRQPWLVRIESGEYRYLDLVRLERIADALGRSLGDLLTFTSQPETRDDDDTSAGPERSANNQTATVG